MASRIAADDPLAVALDALTYNEALAICFDANRRGPGLLWDWLKRLALESFQTDPSYPAVPEDMPDSYRRDAALVALIWCKMPDRRIRAFYRALLDHLIPQTGRTDGATE